MGEKKICFREKLRRTFKKAKDFDLMKYLLTKKEGNLLHDIELQEGLIEHYLKGIILSEEVIVKFEEGIIEKKKLIKKLETDVKKVQKVIRM